jgi:3',5'-cyclic AMP phosphodiesterase CpdA
MNNVLRIAVLSDIHADEDGGEDTHVVTEPPMSSPKENPLRDLEVFTRGQAVQADLLLTSGDLANKASARGRIYGWNLVQAIGANLGVSDVIATVGNHDVVTREPSIDPAQDLKLLVPAFPTSSKDFNEEYWQMGFYLDDSNPYHRVLNINSCADFPLHPGAGGSVEDNFAHVAAIERGRATPERIAAILDRLEPLEEKPVNILLIHHHPAEHARSAMFKDTYGPMANGDELLGALEAFPSIGRWMVIHGHKHIPDFTVNGGTSYSPLVLSAASVGGKLWQPISTATRNQFHVVEFELDRIVGTPRTRGSVYSWSWSVGAGWIPAPDQTGLPARFGFGAVVDSSDLADQVVMKYESVADEIVNWKDIVDAIPLVRYQAPKDFIVFEASLEHSGLALQRDRDQTVRQIARIAEW